MTLNEYQEQAMTTCMDSCDNFSYMMLNLVGEVGEFSSKVAKSIRKENSGIGLHGEPNKIVFSMECTLESMITEEQELKKEAGDILWQVAGLCKVMGWDLDDIAQMNLDKLKSRKERGKIDGNGDNR